MAKKFILVDQSIAGPAGHHYEYAVHVLEAAQRAGFTTVLATHRRYRRDSTPTPWSVHSIFRNSFWASQGPPRFPALGRLYRNWTRFVLRLRVDFTFSRIGLAWHVRKRFSDMLLANADVRYIASVAALVPVVAAIKILRLAGLLLLLPVMAVVFLFRAAARLLKAGGFPPSYVRRLFSDAADFRRLIQLLAERRVKLLTSWQQVRCTREFADDTRSLLQMVQPAQGDVIFLPTVSPVELEGIALALRDKKLARGVTWRLMFRRNVYEGRPGTYASQDREFHELRQALRGCLDAFAGSSVTLYTDTDELTEQYNRLGSFRFHTAPIPHTTPMQQSAQAEPLRVIYLGDARREKGYHLLPSLIQDVWTSHVAPGKVTFHLQSNYNLVQGEAEAVIARSQLELLPSEKVELLKEPMDSRQYRDFLLSADINLLLYDASNYYARSSGILVESLTAGIPVIVPAGTWLARQFMREMRTYQESLRIMMTVLATVTLDDLKALAQAESDEDDPASERDAFFTPVPPGSTRLLARLSWDAAPSDGLLLVDPVDQDGNESGSPVVRVLEADSCDGKAVTLIPIEAGTTRLRIRIRSLDSLRSSDVTDLRIDFLAPAPDSPPPPTGAVGLVYHDPSEIAGLLREMIDHYPHYRGTARTFAGPFYAYHNADRLVEVLR